LEVIVADGGSRDGTLAAAVTGGARVIAAPSGRGQQLARGADAARGQWLLFLHADTRLTAAWPAAVEAFIAEPVDAARAGYFRFCLDDEERAARRIERLVAWRCRHLALPYGDQGLLISRALYREVGGYRPFPLMEDVDLVRRLGRARLAPIACDAVTSAARYRREGYIKRPLRNISCLTLYFLGVPPQRLALLYG
jgi:rSAM/selenodomain-associated transferase 2